MCARGKLPRSYKLSETDSTYLHAHLYDAALAVIATVGGKPSLATEIVDGLVLSDIADTPEGSVPAIASNQNASIISDPDYARNSINAIVAYSLGYFLEINQGANNWCQAAKMLRQLLAFLESHRDFVYKNGLIKAGVDDSGANILEAYTEDNLLAYFAFAQAGSVLNDSNYQSTADELKTAINSKLWNVDRFRLGLNSTGSPLAGESLLLHALGALYWAEIGFPSNVTTLLANAENYVTVDGTIGAKGYRAGNTGSSVWFEGSYMVALGHYKVNNQAKYKTIINELNKFKDSTDGGVRGSIIKETGNASFINVKGVGSTAWSLIANLSKAQAFTIRTNALISICPVPYFNDALSVNFTKQGCPSGFTPSVIPYNVRAGRYISYDSQTAANQLATDEATAYGQLNANVKGQCQGQIGNDVQSQVFYSTQCPSTTTPDPYTYTVQADTYFAATKSDANALALADIAANGQAEADANGDCIINFLNIALSVTSFVENNFGQDDVYYNVYATQPITANIQINCIGQSGSGGSYLLFPANMAPGQTNSTYNYAGSWPTGQGGNVTIIITSVTPNPDSSGTNYTW